MATPNTLHDFLQLNTRIVGESNNLETSFYSEIENLLSSHLKLTPAGDMASLGVNVYKLNIGTKVTIAPSDWAVRFSEEKNLELGTEYGRTYEIVDIKFEYCSKHPHADLETPFVVITVFLKPTT